MKLSKKTIDVLKNFSTINANLFVKAGSTISTMAIQKNIFASIDVDEKFPEDFGIFNLAEFLGVLSLYSDPELVWDKKFVTIKEGTSKMRYTFAEPSILTYPTKTIKMPSKEVEFTLTPDHVSKIQKAAAAISVQDVVIVGDGKKVVVKVADRKNSSGNEYIIDLEAETDIKFEAITKVEHLKMMPDTYSVALSAKRIAEFVGEGTGATYFVAIDEESHFE
jgi:hypothetical protein